MAEPPPAKNYAITDFSRPGSLELQLADGTALPVTAFNATWALNEIPQAQCYLAVGRQIRSPDAPSPVHLVAQGKQMVRATVRFQPRGEYAAGGVAWPEAAQVVFRGYFLGFSSRKVSDKFVIVANLVHWLADMGCSSALTGNGHVANPALFSVAAVLDSGALDGTGAGQGVNISNLVVAQPIAELVRTDVWAALKQVFCVLAATSTQPCGPDQGLGGAGTYAKNDRALIALKRIEGGDGACAFVDASPERYAVPLAVDTTIAGALDSVHESIAYAIGEETIATYAATSFWDKLISQFCPMFNLAVVPMVERALVIADTPAYRGAVWKTIDDEYDSLDFSGTLERPLRGVGVTVQYESPTAAGLEADASASVQVGGAYVEDSVEPGDGMIQFVASPSWLRITHAAPSYSGATSGVARHRPGRAAGADAPGANGAGDAEDSGGETTGTDFSQFYTRYAQMVYVNAMLRGRVGSIAGQLRFDIAPGSIVRIRTQPERFLADDTQALTLIGCVSRVSVSINAEAKSAATSFGLTHMRVEDPENAADRTSVARHPLFGTAIHGGGKHGSPLIPAYDNLAPPATATGGDGLTPS